MVYKRKRRPVARVVEQRLHAPSVVLPDICTLFRDLGVNVALAADETWYPIQIVQSVIQCESARGAIESRWRYNTRCFTRVHRYRQTVLGRHAGFYDFFVPVGQSAHTAAAANASVSPGAEVWGILAAGPFAVTRASGADALDRWQQMTNVHGHLGDPAFSQYLSMTLSTLTLEGARVDDFKQLLLCLSKLLGTNPDRRALAKEVAVLRDRLYRLRISERMWNAAQEMVDERTTGLWQTRNVIDALADLQIARMPQHAAVGLLLDGRDDRDPVDAVVRRDGFCRACVGLAVELGGVVCGRVGDYGVALLLDEQRPGARAQRSLLEIARRAVLVARRHGLGVHFGIAVGGGGNSLPLQYRSALHAAEKALTQGLPIVEARGVVAQRTSILASLRRDLDAVIKESPARLPASFDRYIEAASVHCGYRLDRVGARLEAGFERIVDTLTDVGVVDEKTRAELPDAVERDAAEARTLDDLATVYRRAVSGLALAAVSPTDARQQRSIRRALAFIGDHLSEPLTLANVSRVAGFAPAYFSTLFAKSEHTTFRHYVSRLRVERAKRMLASTTLNVERVAQLCGFVSRVHFHQAFRRYMKMTPSEYRERSMSGPRRRAEAMNGTTHKRT
jgi:AraC-like DNA-binding protein